MFAIPPDLTRVFEALLAKQDIPVNQRPSYHKWLRYYLDFCQKYSLEPSERRNFSGFDEKLRTKNQSEPQRQQARQVIAVYCKGIVGHPAVRLQNQAEAMAQAKPPVQFSHLNPTNATNPSQANYR